MTPESGNGNILLYCDGTSRRNNTWTFDMIFSRHNHYLCYKLVGHPIACLPNSEENKLVFDMMLNMVHPKNTLTTLKRKRPKNV